MECSSSLAESQVGALHILSFIESRCPISRNSVRWRRVTPSRIEPPTFLTCLERRQLDHGSVSREYLHKVMLLFIDRPRRGRAHPPDAVAGLEEQEGRPVDLRHEGQQV